MNGTDRLALGASLAVAAAVIVAVAVGYRSNDPIPDTSTPVTAADVRNGVLDIPEWGADLRDVPGCEPGVHDFTDGVWVSRTDPELGDYGTEQLGRPQVGDVTGDGVADAAVVLACNLHEGLARQVVVLDRGPEGLETVAALRAPITDGVPQKVVSAGDGEVVVSWADPQLTETQQRTYVVEGGALRQVAGPTSF